MGPLLGLVIWAVVWYLGMVWYLLAAGAQTRVSPDQVSKTLTVVEWAVCEAEPIVSPGGLIQDCRGVELYRFRLADGQTRGPFLAVPAPEGWDKIPGRFTWRQLQ